MSKTRGLLPQTVLLNILNRIVMFKIGPVIDAANANRGSQSMILVRPNEARLRINLAQLPKFRRRAVKGAIKELLYKRGEV